MRLKRRRKLKFNTDDHYIMITIDAGCAVGPLSFTELMTIMKYAYGKDNPKWHSLLHLQQDGPSQSGIDILVRKGKR